MTKKPDTSDGFSPHLVLGEDTTVPATECLRLDGRLESAVLSPAIHQVILAMARLRNVVSSLKIEGEAIELPQARAVLETGVPRGPEEAQVLAMSRAYSELHAAEKPPSLTPAYVREVHRRLFEGGAGLDGGKPGKFKEVPNGVFSVERQRWVFEATPPERTESELAALFQWFQGQSSRYPPAVAGALFFAEFQAIHPFEDGNGRVGRFLNLAVLRTLGHRNVALVPLDGRFFRTRNSYYDALGTTNTGKDYGIWARYFTKQLRRAYEIAVGRADLRPAMERFSRPSTRSLMEWCLQGESSWFGRSDFPNPKRYSGPAVTAALRELAAAGVLEARGERRGRRYRLSTEFLRKVYGRDLTTE